MINRVFANRLITVCLLVVGLLVLLHLATGVFLSREFLNFDDYIEYWSVARLNLAGANPYDPDQLEQLQRKMGRTEQVPLMMWNPPWTLALVTPISLFGYPVSRLIWLLVSVGATAWCADWLWSFHGGSKRQRWIAWFAVFSFGPALQAFKAGQIGPILLLGIGGFLCLNAQGRDWYSGAVLVLTTLKPHLLYLVGFSVMLWVIDSRRWGVLLGGLTTLVTAMGVVWVINPALPSQYLYALTHYPPAQWMTSTLGGVLRLVFGADKLWLQFAPSIVGGFWLVGYWLRRRTSWCWQEDLPLVLLVSVLTAAYGWTHDQTVLIAALMPVAVAWSRSGWQAGVIGKVGLFGSYAVINGSVLFASMHQVRYWWLAPFFVAWYLLVTRVVPARTIPDLTGPSTSREAV